jgi:hypothetical protein
VPSSISFSSKPYDFIPCLNLLKVILPVPGLFSTPFLGQYSNHESATVEVISEESALDRGICAGFIVADPDGSHPKVLLCDELIISSDLSVAYR